jgi:hypothetical protein
MGLVTLAAFLEWFLWLAAFLYCLVKVYQKADTWTVKLLAVVMMILFFALRSVALHLSFDQILTFPQSRISPHHDCNFAAS